MQNTQLKKEITTTEMKQLLIDAFELEVSVDEIDDDTELFKNGLELDSIDVLEIFMQVENKFAIKVPSNQRNYDFLQNVSTLTQYLNNL